MCVRSILRTQGKRSGTASRVRCFRFEGLPFDSRREKHRTSYNAAIHNVQSPDKDKKEKAVATIRDLADQKYPAAMSLLGVWMMEGQRVDKDQRGGIALIREAAGKHDSAGLYELGHLMMEGQIVSEDGENGLKLLREAATYGSAQAQFYLGLKYETGDANIAADGERARHYFRLCAARGVALCQFHLGRLLMPVPGEAKGDALQAVAWLELAQAGSIVDADPLLVSLRAKLSGDEMGRAEKLKTQLTHR